jgi:large subunit ribosomal protein L19
MQSIIDKINAKYKKPHVVTVHSGDTVRVHQKIKEGSKERVQVFEGMVIRTSKSNSHTASITVRKVASGIGVEKTYMIHNPLVVKIEVTKRSKVRRNYLSYMRQRSGKSARLASVDFDKQAVNAVPEVKEEVAAEAPVAEAQEEAPKEA